MFDIGIWQVAWANKQYVIVKRLDGEKGICGLQGRASQLRLIRKLVLKRLLTIKPSSYILLTLLIQIH